MDKLKMHSINKVDENIEKIENLFPNCVTEAKVDGKLTRVVDFDKLKQELSNFVVEGRDERYQFTWPDKKQSILLANAPIAKTLRPCVAESVDFDSTHNLYIEGDNLDVLKLLQETYLGRVKMIYIDPPYNTGNDFVYEDDFAQNTEEYLANSGQFDEEGNRLVKNLDSNGRFHTDWLNMIYPRLRVSRDLLADEGVIFISIDDGEADNLRKICNEIFGEVNFVADLTVVNNLKGRNDKKYIARANERLLMYVKTSEFEEYGLELGDKTLAEYSLKDKNGQYRLLELRKRGGPDTRKERPNMYYPFYVNEESGKVSLSHSEYYKVEAYPVKSNGEDGRWRWGRDTASKNIDQLYGKMVRNKFNIYEKDYLENNEGARRIKPKSVLSGALYSTDVATKEYRALMGKIDFSNPKPTALLTDLITYATKPNENAIILDFFSGSSTTAHGVLQTNALDGGNRKFIMVQIPEATDEKSEAYKAGYSNICEIGKERIRRAGKKIKEANPETAQDLDTGFRVLKLDSTNMKDVFYTPEDTNISMFSDLTDNIKADRTPEDLLFQVMLDLGVLLSSKIETLTIDGKTIFSVADGFLMACFDEKLTDATITAIAKMKPYYFVMRDHSLATDAVAANFEQIFAAYSPDTIRKVL